MKRLLIIALSIIFIAPFFAFEWGGYFDNNSTLFGTNSINTGFNQSNSISLWASTAIDKEGNFYIKGEGTYKYNYNTLTSVFNNYLDLDLLKLAGNISTKSGNINISLGRFSFSDITGAIFTQTCDGGYFQYQTKNIEASIYAGYTGLLNSNTVCMLDRAGNIFPAKNKIYALSTPYIPVVATISFPALFANQTLSLQGSGFIDLSNDAYNRMYATVNLSGSLASSALYSLTTSMGTENFKTIMNYSKVSVSILPTSNSLIGLEAVYASGNTWGLSSFRGFSSNFAYNAAVDYQTSNCLIFGANTSINLFQNKMLLVLSGKRVLSFESGLFGRNSLLLLGFQGDANIVYNIFNDLQIGIGASGFKSASDHALDSYAITFKLALTF